MLKRNFFEQPTLLVAELLLGKIIVFNTKNTVLQQPHKAMITETEAYIGQDDPACHAARGCTPRTKVMFGPAGYSYVYLIYGMYHCLNFVTEQEGFPAAVLIRAVKLVETEISGPGRLCRHLGITREHNAIDITQAEHFHIVESGITLPFITTPRIGITKGIDKPWRFLVAS